MRDFGWPWLLIALIGIGLIFRRDSRLGVWIIVTAVLSGLFTFTYQIPDYARYFTVHVALLSLGLAVGIAVFASVVCRLLERAGESGRRVGGLLVGSLLIILAVARVTVQTAGDAGAVVAAHRRHAAEMNDNAIRQILHMEPESVYLVDWASSWHSRYLIYARGVSREKNLDVRTVNYATMGVEQAEDILFSGRHLYLQRVTADFERDFRIVPQGAFFQAFFGLELKDGDLVKGSDDRIYLIVGGARSWIPSGEIFLALGYRWDRVRQIDDRELDTIPVGPNLSEPG